MCHKYRNDDACRFLFPHEIVEASYFDPETNAVVLLCRDGNVNYLNSYILVFCRHNHDIKCILSGKGAKAAMFYITDYITKMDVKTHQMLSLLSCAVIQAQTTYKEDASVFESAKTLLHKCLSQFSCQQQIHAQQTAHYLCGMDDMIPSHKTIPMMSALLISYVKDMQKHSQKFIVDSEEDNTDDEVEPTTLKISVDIGGKLCESNQVEDYLYRGETLSSMCFYDFCRCVRVEKNLQRSKVQDLVSL